MKTLIGLLACASALAISGPVVGQTVGSAGAAKAIRDQTSAYIANENAKPKQEIKYRKFTFKNGRTIDARAVWYDSNKKAFWLLTEDHIKSVVKSSQFSESDKNYLNNLISKLPKAAPKEVPIGTVGVAYGAAFIETQEATKKAEKKSK